MKNSSITKYLVAAFVGLAFSWYSVAFWIRYVVNHPIGDWLLDVLARQGHNGLYYLCIYTHDLIINIVLAVPAAIALTAFEGSNNWRCVMIASATVVIANYWDMVWSSLPTLVRFWEFWYGFGVSILWVPIAFAFVKGVRNQLSLLNG